MNPCGYPRWKPLRGSLQVREGAGLSWFGGAEELRVLAGSEGWRRVLVRLEEERAGG